MSGIGGLPFGFGHWLPAAQGATLGLLTFVQEDVPLVTAALLGAAGKLAWSTGFLSVFLGIWIGDALLYLLARGLGRPLLERSWSQRFFDPVAIARSERWFAEKGTWLLLSSRFVPGTRLPTYVAAGFLRLPFGKFLAVTGSAVAVWTLGIFTIAATVGPELVNWLKRLNSGAWSLLVAGTAVLLFIHAFRALIRRKLWRRVRAAIGRWTRWEFWPAWFFYAPVALNYLRLATQYRCFTLPTAANPGIFSGGFVGESKIATLRDLQTTSRDFTAEAHLLESGEAFARVKSLQKLCCENQISYPLILKPDVGQRGAGVKLIRTPVEAATYLQETSAALVVQRYAPGPLEVGIFYYRFPHEQHGHIFAITEKLFPSITGDGRQTIEDLIWQDPRARFVANRYLMRLGGRRTEVPVPGQTVRLVETGNHAQGCIFQDGMRLWSEALEARIDNISQELDGIFIGRYDIRYASEEDLRAGRNFQIIELNGAAAEATSIYDARNSLFNAYRTLFRQWELVFAIGAANRNKGSSPTKLSLLWRTWRQNSALLATYPLAD